MYIYKDLVGSVGLLQRVDNGSALGRKYAVGRSVGADRSQHPSQLQVKSNCFVHFAHLRPLHRVQLEFYIQLWRICLKTESGTCFITSCAIYGQ